MNQPETLIAICGSDMHQSNMAALSDEIRKGAHILAVDSLAYDIAVNCGYPVTFLDQWIDPPMMRRLGVAAATLERQWFLPANAQFTCNEICWPLFDHQAMHWFWRDTVLATAFYCLFVKAGGSEIKVLGNTEERPTVFYDTSQPWKQVFLAFSRARKEMFSRYHQNLTSLLNTFVEPTQGKRPARFRRGNATASQFQDSPFLPSKNGKIVFAFNPGEAQRFIPMIRHLAPHFEVEVITIFDNYITAQEISSACGVPVTPLSHPVDIDPDCVVPFDSAWNEVLENAQEFPLRHVLELYQYHFRYYCANRWPTLSGTLNQWMHTWRHTAPRCVITSQLVDAESQLPAESAKRLGIPTIALPHGGMYFGDEAQTSHYSLYSFRTHKYHLMAGGTAEKTIIACRNAVASNEYSMDDEYQQPSGGQGSLRILVLCAPTTLEGSLMPLVNVQAQIQAVKSLLIPPANLSGCVQVKFKVHPGWPDMETIKAAGADVNRDVLPVKSDLHSLLPSFDLVIDMNLSGAAIIHVIRAGRPVIFFWPARVNFGHWYEEIFLRAGVLAETTKVLWQEIELFLSDQLYVQRLTAKAKRFCQNYLDDSAYPELKDLIGQLPHLSDQKAEPARPDIMQAASHEKERTLDIINIDADPSFYYGEIPEDHLNWIFSQNETIGDIEAATQRYCSEMGNEYFRKYALDPRRALYLGLCGSIDGLKVLDYGCGLGSLGIPAASAGAEVTFVDSCLARLRFASTRCQEAGLTKTSFYGCKTWRSLPFTPGSFDLIVLNGIMEWVPKTIGATFETVLEAQLDFLKVMAGLLKPTGRIFLAIENRFALQYLMGYPEDHTDIKYLSIMPRKEANELHRQQKGDDFVTWTWGYEDYRRLLPKVGLILAEEYGMFPDYRFPQLIAPLQDTAAVKRGMLLEEYEAPVEERRRMIDYLAEMGQLHQAVYSFGFILRKSES